MCFQKDKEANILELLVIIQLLRIEYMFIIPHKLTTSILILWEYHNDN